MHELAECSWQQPGGVEAAQRIAAFLQNIGIPVEVGSDLGPTFLTGLALKRGTIQIDRDVPAYPGDLLHEAGHIAVMEEAERASSEQPPVDGGSEMAAIVWSVAAAQACGIGLDVLFHDHGYKGEAAWLREQFAAGVPFGLPLLVWMGMTSNDTFPTMHRWLR
ncbi:MAG: hypothetical protein ACKOOL_08960 [Novosphingobium sp.]